MIRRTHSLFAALLLVMTAVAVGCGNGNASGPVPSVDPTVAVADVTTAGAVSGGMPVGAGGLSVQEALATDAENPLAVHGFLVGRGVDVRLCTALLPTTPPACGDPSMPVQGIDLVTMSSTMYDGGTTWTDHEVSLLVDRVEGALRVLGTTK